MRKILVSMFLLVFGLCLVGCNLAESKTFTIALRDGLYSGQYNDIYDIYIEFDNISIMEFVKTQTGNCMKDLYTKDEKYYTPYDVHIIITSAAYNEKIYNTIIRFKDMVAINNQTTTTYKLSNITDDGSYDISKFNIELVDTDNDLVADKLNLDIESKFINGECELVYHPESGSEDLHSIQMVNYSLTYDENLVVEVGHYENSKTVISGYKLVFYVKSSSIDKEVLMYINDEQVGHPQKSIYHGDEWYEYEYIIGYSNVDIRFKEVPIFHEHEYIDGLCECGEFDSVWLNENFRLSDEQILFKGSVDDEFKCNVILLTLKHTPTYIELSKKHFKLVEITEVVYISSTPPSHFYEPGNEDKLDNFHQIVFLYVDVESKEDIIELIKELEKLPFIRSAEPNYIEHPC